ncbi:hypothetical protein M8J75_007223 [Diaphorina citri]|nr:hypothetical protein M8J75_007223 [Diaphorina citri]
MRNQTDRLIKEDSEIIEHNTSININNNRISAFPPNLLSPTFYSQGGLSLPVMSSLFIPNPHPYIQGINTWTPPLSASKYPPSQISVDTQASSKKRRKSESHESISPDIQPIPLSPPTSGSSPQTNYNNGTLPLLNKRERKSRDIRRVIRFPPVPATMLLPATVEVPEQTEPEDLSMPSRRLTPSPYDSPSRVMSNNNNSNSSSSEDEDHHGMPPKLVLDVDFIHRHPKFRTKNYHHVTASP